MVLPSGSDMSPSITLSNGHKSPLSNNVMTADSLASDAESELSEPADPPSPYSPASRDDARSKSQNPSALRSSSTFEKDDVFGSDDGDFDVESPPAAPQDHMSSAHSSEDESPRPPKRKLHADDEEEYIRRNPELYGLRRSGRERAPRAVINDSTDEDSDSDIVASRPRKRQRPLSHQSSKRPTPARNFADQSDSESDAYGGARARQTQKQRRRHLLSSGTLTPSHGEIRFSTRRSNKVSNYNEDEDDDMFDEDEDEMLTPNYAIVGEEDNRPAIDIVLDHRPNEGVVAPSESRHDYEFLIKWQGKAYYHSTWETTETLSKCKSTRRLDNYVRKTLVEAFHAETDPDFSADEKEKRSLDREQYLETLNDFKKVERVIGVADGEEGTEYYVKWKGLFYDQATWESAALVSEIAQAEIDRYLERSSQLPVSKKSESNPQTRSTFSKINEQPEYIRNGQLRDFQMKGLNFLAFNWCKGNNVVLADEMGLGKTVQTVSFMNWLRHDRQQQGPFIVVVPLSTMPSWAETFDNWTPDINYVVYSGNQASRNIIKQQELLIDGDPRRTKFHVLLTTYEYVLLDAPFLSQLKWQFMAVDEAHRLKNRESQLYDKLLEFKTPSRLLITGTPIQNNLSELAALLDFLMPGKVKVDENMDLTSEAAREKLELLTKEIAPLMLRRTKKVVEGDLPPKTEKIIRVELADTQLEYYKNILAKNYHALNQGAKGPKLTLQNIVMELKKASDHPFMFPTAHDRLVADDARNDEILRATITNSGKMMLLDQLLAKMKRDNHRVLIFSQMVKMLDILADYMNLRGYNYQRLDGTIPAGSRRVAIEHFNSPDSKDFVFLLSTRAGGLGINLMTADTVILFDSDWNPQADLQAMSRAHRIGQVKPVSVYRLVSKDTIEEEILERARNKLMLEYVTIQRSVTDKDNEAAAKLAKVSEPTNADDISRILKVRSQKMFEQTSNQKSLEEIDIDNVLENAEVLKDQEETITNDGGEEFLKNFEFVDVKVDDKSWDEIIPEPMLAEIKAEDEKKKNEEFLRQQIEQNQPRKRNATTTDTREERQAKRQARAHVAESSDSENEISVDPKRPVSSTREYRYLIKGLLRWGSLDEKKEEFLEEARLRNRDEQVVRAALKEVVDEAERLTRLERQRMEDLEKNQNKVLTKKDKKAVLFEFKGVKRLNAETILERPVEMRLLREVTSAVADPKSFRVPDATKSAGYTCPWGPKEDGMLCVGIARHGYGAWEKIRDDPDLALADKFFLEEHRVEKKAERQGQESNARSPGAVHLVRRADYLLSVLKSKYIDDPAAKKAVENHHRNNKKNGLHARGSSAGVSASPGPAHRKPQRESDKIRSRAYSHSHRDSVHRDSVERHHTPKVESRYKHGADDDGDREKKRRRTDEHHQDRDTPHDHQHHRHQSNDQSKPNVGQEELIRALMKPVRDTLKRIQGATKEAIPDKHERALALRVGLIEVGNFISKTVAEDEFTPGVVERFWDYAALYWPNKSLKASSDIQAMYNKLIQTDTTLAG